MPYRGRQPISEDCDRKDEPNHGIEGHFRDGHEVCRGCTDKKLREKARKRKKHRDDAAKSQKQKEEKRHAGSYPARNQTRS